MKTHRRFRFAARMPSISASTLLCLTALSLCWALAASPVIAGPAPKTSGPPQMEGWLTSVAEAVELAEKNDAYIVVDLYAEWCGWCKVLEEKVFSTPRFKKFAEARNFVLLRVDTEDGGDGSGLQSRFQAFSLPTTLILDSKFVKIGSVSGFAPIDAFLKYVDDQVKAWDVVGANFEMVSKSDDAELKRDLAQELHERGDGARAAILYESVIKQVQPGTEAFAWLHYMTADAYRMARQFDLAHQWLGQAARLTEKLENGSDELQERVDLLSFYIAQDNGDCKQAVSSIKTFLDAHPKSLMRHSLERTLSVLKEEEACST